MNLWIDLSNIWHQLWKNGMKPDWQVIKHTLTCFSCFPQNAPLAKQRFMCISSAVTAHQQILSCSSLEMIHRYSAQSLYCIFCSSCSRLHQSQELRAVWLCEKTPPQKLSAGWGRWNHLHISVSKKKQVSSYLPAAKDSHVTAQISRGVTDKTGFTALNLKRWPQPWPKDKTAS